MLQIAVCDDEPLSLADIEQKTKQCLMAQNIFPVIATFSSGELLLYELEDGAFFDLLLLDIELPEISGMELAKKIRQKLPDALIIFVTAHYKYAVDAYELDVFRYVPKNQLSGRLAHAVTDAAAVLETQRCQSYIINSQTRMERIPLKDILYIIREGKNSVFHMKNNAKEIRLRKSLSDIYSGLSPDEFLFIDRGCIVNLRHIAGIENSDCILTDGSRHAIALSRITGLKRKLNAYWSIKI